MVVAGYAFLVRLGPDDIIAHNLHHSATNACKTRDKTMQQARQIVPDGFIAS
jgi:hypothetical protein